MPEGLWFPQPRATPWEWPNHAIFPAQRANRSSSNNGWPVGPIGLPNGPIPQGVALGWKKRSPSGNEIDDPLSGQLICPSDENEICG